MRIVLATHNAGKLAEFATLLSGVGVTVLSIGEFTQVAPEETGLSFVENAILKARHAARVSGLPSIADDSGLEVDALRGAPGVHSARYAGAAASDAQNIDKLLADMADVPDAERQARFRCALVFMRWESDPAPLISMGRWDGCILRQPQGEAGFGYDPVFEVAGLGKSAAQLTPIEKNRLSHRGQALQGLVGLIAAG